MYYILCRAYERERMKSNSNCCFSKVRDGLAQSLIIYICLPVAEGWRYRKTLL